MGVCDGCVCDGYVCDGCVCDGCVCDGVVGLLLIIVFIVMLIGLPYSNKVCISLSN